MKISPLIFAGLLGAIASPAVAQIPQIQHVIFVIQENRTPDNLFHGLNAYLPGVDIANSGLNTFNQSIALTPVPLAGPYDLAHGHNEFTRTYNRGLMNGANTTSCQAAKGKTCPINPAYAYVNPSDVTPYFSIAVNYGWANRMFSTQQSGSYPGHQMLLSGTSQLTPTSPLFLADDVLTYSNGVGCAATSAAISPFLNPNGKFTFLFPCTEHATLTDLLDNPPSGQPISWRYYNAPAASAYWFAPNTIQHMCLPGGSPLTCTNPNWTNGTIVPNSIQVLQDIQNGNLASMNWVIPSGYESDHALGGGNSGPSWVSSIVNAVGNSPYWYNTVIFITWDDWGGWYDHVKPPIDPTWGYYEYGFRVPLLVVSAYTPQGYISNATHDFGSMLKFVEKVFGLGLIPPGTFADSRADDLSDFFNFTAMPRPFTPISAPLSANHFLQYLKNDPRPPMPPDND